MKLFPSYKKNFQSTEINNMKLHKFSQSQWAYKFYRLSSSTLFCG